MPVVKGEKTADERFPGAVSTLTIEAMMQDRKALQAGTSHFLGQNFARAQDITFQDQHGTEQFAWTTSWGVSTRLVGALLMTHSDDDGLVLPPRLAPKHVVILPILKNEEDRTKVLEYCHRLKAELESQQYAGDAVRVQLDDRDIRGGEKKWHHVKRGVPLRAEVGPRDIESDSVYLGRRDTGESEAIGCRELVQRIAQLLEEIQSNLFTRAKKLLEDNSQQIDNLDDFISFFTPPNGEASEIHGGFAWSFFNEDPKTTEVLNKLKVTVRCIPLDEPGQQGTCLFTGKPSTQRAVFARSY